MAFTLAEGFHPAEQYRRFAFTLAEVLITLGIIGVVAALTMPSLIANHRKQVVVTRMQKFYSTINQAVKLSEVDNGDVEHWTLPTDIDSTSIMSWWNTYLSKYYVAASVKEVADGIFVKNNDGSAFGMYKIGASKFLGPMHIVFCVNADACQKHLDNNSNKLYDFPLDGKNTFLFKGLGNHIVTYYYGGETDKNRDILFNTTTRPGTYGCAQSYKAYCAALIEYDGWKIAPDYPVKF